MSRSKSFRSAICAALCLVGIGLFVGPAVAGPLITYQVSLTIESVEIPSTYADDLYFYSTVLHPYDFFGIVAPGQTFVGSFAVDSGILASDGIKTAPVYDFRLPLGAALYSNGLDNLTLTGFRNQFGLGANAPGFRILNGDVVDLVGGVYGTSDVPFIDFISPNHFSAIDWGLLWARGSLIVSRVPEPETYALLLAGLGVLGFVTRRKKKLQAVAA